MTRQPHLHAPFPESVELDFQPVKLQSTRIGRAVLAAIDDCASAKQVPRSYSRTRQKLTHAYSNHTSTAY